jgi:hypothetical protein
MLSASESPENVPSEGSNVTAKEVLLSQKVMPAVRGFAQADAELNITSNSHQSGGKPFLQSNHLAAFCKMTSSDSTLSSWEQAVALLSAVGDASSRALDGQAIGALFQSLGKVVRDAENAQLIGTILEELPSLKGNWRSLCSKARELLGNEAVSVGNFVRVLWGFSRLQVDDPRLKEAVADAAHSMLPRMSPWQCSVSVLSFGHLGAANHHLWDSLATSAVLIGHKCDDTALSSIVRGFVLAEEYNQQVLYQFAAHAETLLRDETVPFSARALAILLQSYVHSPIKPAGLFQATADAIASGRLSDLHGRELSQLASYVARTKCDGVEFSDAVLSECKKLTGSLEPRALSALILNLGSTGVQWSKQCKPLAAELLRLTGQCNGVELSDIAQGLSAMRCERNDIYAKVIERATSLLQEHSLSIPGALAIASSASLAGTEISTDFYNSLASYIDGLNARNTLPDLEPLTLVQLAQLFGRREYSNVRVLATVYRLVRESSAKFSSPQLVAVLFGCSRSEYRDDVLAEAITSRVLSRELNKSIAIQNHEILHQLLVTSATMGFSKHALNQVVIANFVSQPQRYSNRSIGMLAWAAAQLNIEDEQFWDVVGSEILERLRSCDTNSDGGVAAYRSAISVGWALSGYYPDKAAEVLSLLPDNERFSENERIQLHQAKVAAGLSWSGDYPESLRAAMMQYSKAAQKKGRNALENQIYQVISNIPELQSAKVLSQEVIDGIEVDFLVKLPTKAARLGARAQLGQEQGVVVEADGYRHFLHGDQSGVRRGCDRIQDQVFKRAGLKVLHISADEFLDAKDKVEFIRSRLVNLFE